MVTSTLRGPLAERRATQSAETGCRRRRNDVSVGGLPGRSARQVHVPWVGSFKRIEHFRIRRTGTY